MAVPPPLSPPASARPGIARDRTATRSGLGLGLEFPPTSMSAAMAGVNLPARTCAIAIIAR
ncbi:unnamed protein product, partial [Protopolystoma xenopodis]